MSYYRYPNRTFCDILSEMREVTKLLDPMTADRYKNYMAIMIEELQTVGNRMEAGLSDQYDIRKLHEQKKKLADELKELEAKVSILNPNKENDDL